MSDKTIKDLQREYRLRFGQVAVRMGFINGMQLKEALGEQIDEDLAEMTHRFTGEILLARRWITGEQLDIILDELFKEEMRIKGKL